MCTNGNWTDTDGGSSFEPVCFKQEKNPAATGNANYYVNYNSKFTFNVEITNFRSLLNLEYTTSLHCLP